MRHVISVKNKIKKKNPRTSYKFSVRCGITTRLFPSSPAKFLMASSEIFTAGGGGGLRNLSSTRFAGKSYWFSEFLEGEKKKNTGSAAAR